MGWIAVGVFALVSTVFMRMLEKYDSARSHKEESLEENAVEEVEIA
jgi:hypothetical protein